ncbi:MAG: hypothetical protein QOJ25_3074, partial [Solirubrobacteraceae bacterium]|nr:hypothetical protein [Solirubrobacteraceae bacterium]
MRGQRSIATLACACALVIAGCGSSGPGGSSTAPPHQAGNGEASKPAAQILSDAAGAVRAARSYSLRAVITQNGRPLRLTLRTTGPTSLELGYGNGATFAQVIELARAFYFNGNDAYWRPRLGARAPLAAGRWFQVPPSLMRKTISSLGHLAPATLSRCLAEDHDTLRVVGMATVDGQRAILIKDAGNLPGSTPSEYAVAATGPPYPLRATSLGRSR